MPFLAHRDPRPLSADAPSGVRPGSLFIGAGSQALEVAVYSADRRLTNPELRALHEQRAGRRASPVVIVVLRENGRATLAGPGDAELAIIPDVDTSQIERLCDAALGAPDRHAALRYLRHALPQLTATVPGLRNEGLFALHELEVGVPARGDWADARTSGSALLGSRGRSLIEGLGFTIRDTAGPAAILVARSTKVAIAVFLERPEEIDAATPRYDNASPITHALAKADEENLDYVVVAAGSTLRVYPVRPGVGVGRRGRTDTFVELNLDILGPDNAGYVWLLCSADALVRDGSFTAILTRSADYAADLGSRLRERVYNDVVPALATAIVRARRLRNPSAERLRETYEMALLVLFRLLFVAYAEDKDLLPLHANAEYRRHSLKELAKRLADAQARNLPFERQDFYWTEVVQLWKAVKEGNTTWGVPPYNGGLFSTEDGVGASLAPISLTDAEFAPALAALLIERTTEGVEGPVDFRSLGVREFGTIYEGLLESELSLAEADLAVDPRTGSYVPVTGRATAVVQEGEVYLHDASGARKASGAYYTKDFAVEHLLDRALEPALEDHRARLDALGDPREAAAAFFDFHVADIAMGSGHFLVAALDRIEVQLSNYLARRPLPGVTDELERLRQEALRQLGRNGDPIENTQLLRRQIARRCVFGVDLNPLAVELARLSIWIHTFVPGLPLSFLDANLVIGNSLVGIATFDEANDLASDAGSLFAALSSEQLRKAAAPLARLARLAEADAAEVREAKHLYAEARTAITPVENYLTVLAASRIEGAVDRASAATQFNEHGRVGDALLRKAAKALEGLGVLHFPIVFPQVFLGRRGGFDVIIGNPPWEEATVEEDAFWARHAPGLRALPQREQEARKRQLRRQRPDLVAEHEGAVARAERLRTVLTSGPFPGMGTGDPDVYKAFCWRFWHLLASDGGRLGVVLPRSALSAKGSAEFRLKALLEAKHVDVTLLLNNKQWVFPEVHPQYTIALVTAARGASVGGKLALRGPYASLERYQQGVVRESLVVPVPTLKTWNDTASFPLLPSERSAEVFQKLRRAPRLDLDDGASWRARPQAELHATNDKHLMNLKAEERPEGYWPVFKGESFDIWVNDTGTYYAWANPEKVLPELQRRRARAGRGAFSEFPEDWLEDPDTLPCHGARIAFRDVTRATDTRTVRAALVPPRVFLANTAPYVLWPRGDVHDQSFLLGALCSLPLDWYARRFVETHVNYFVFNPFPIPRPGREHRLWTRVVEIAGRLAAQDRRLGRWARALGLDARRLAPDEQADLIRELDAAMAHLYGLEEADLVHILETFHEGWDFQDRLDGTLEHFTQLRAER